MCGVGFTLSPASAVDALKRQLLAALTPRGPDSQCVVPSTLGGCAALLCATVLHMRGAGGPTPQPLSLPASTLLLCFNGEVFGGLPVEGGECDTAALGAALAAALAQCQGGGAQARQQAVLATAQRVQGPFAFLLWDAEHQTLYFARDALGRRSLLWSLPPGGAPWEEGQALYIGSAALQGLGHTQEVPPAGVYALHLSAAEMDTSQPAPHWCSSSSSSGSGGAAGLAITLAPYSTSAFPARPPHLLHPASATSPPPMLPPAALHCAARGLLRALSAAVRSRVLPHTSAAAPALHAAAAAEPLPPRELWAFPASPQPPPVATALAALQEWGSSGSGSGSSGSGSCSPPPPPGPPASVAVLFSGGLDCMVLAALAHRHLPRHQAIDLLTVDFAADRRSPDRVSAVDGLAELRCACPGRAWNLICVDEAYAGVAEGSALAATAACVHPLASHLDFNLAFVLGAGARGVGYLHACHGGGGAEGGSGEAGVGGWEEEEEEEVGALEAAIQAAVIAPFEEWRAAQAEALPAAEAVAAAAEQAPKGAGGKGKKGGGGKASTGVAVPKEEEGEEEGAEQQQQQQQQAAGPDSQPSPPAAAAAAPSLLVRTSARVLLSGLGADELLGGYGRHRSVHARGGWQGLASELASDAQRLWRRNLGRDDRVVAWHGREARWPYLDEGTVLPFLARLPLHALCDHRLPAGQGDKRLLRAAAGLLGLPRAACRVKRAMHFGSRCVKHSDAAAGGGGGGGGGVTADTPFLVGEAPV